MKETALLIISLMLFIEVVFAQKTIPLYEGEIPNSKPSPNREVTENKDGVIIISNITTPTLSIFLPVPAIATGPSVIICPGGGYWVNAISHEGTDVAIEFAKHGIAAFVLKYRIPNSATMINRSISPLQDAQRAIQMIRSRAKEFNINPNQIGLMGFSAGGHMASTAATHFNKPVIDNPYNVSLRPDFLILIYPVISFQKNLVHLGSMEQLIGESAPQDLVDFYSNELQVTPDTPPTFLVHSSDDEGVKPNNSIVFYESLIKNKIPAELHIYQSGGHGYGLVNKTTSDRWIDRCFSWLDTNGWLKNKVGKR